MGSKAAQPTGTATPNAQNAEQAQWQQEQQMPPISQQVRTTQYGWDSDPNQDYNSNTLKIGNRDNPLTPHAAALTDSEAQQLNAKPGDVLQVGGSKYYYADRAPESDNRVDLYQPQGMDTTIPDYQGVQDLGGGSSSLRGQALADQGEANIQKYGSANPAPQANKSGGNTGLPPMADPPAQITIPDVSQLAPIIDSGRASDNNRGIAFANLLKRVRMGNQNGIQLAKS